MSLADRKNQVQLIKDGLKDLQDWSGLQQAALKELAAAKELLKKAPQDPAAAKRYEKLGEKLLTIMESRNQREASLISARKLFRIYD
ncbi:hypothetical protein BKE38_05250 [Pseudoroseomonas deserti]|uniref:Uncharacterized protein n=1 Tax=Teichococcus deserti TaxID=1817963 RepID=A0A1V2H6B2_9PROT|nr:hypothetical protein [Pseudoroseomonas deserti]ONG56861.1 hypothetical protein BKE38_05250 [Pseudoroseomonas deserti]